MPKCGAVPIFFVGPSYEGDWAVGLTATYPLDVEHNLNANLMESQTPEIVGLYRIHVFMIKSAVQIWY